MPGKTRPTIFVFVLILASLACATIQPVPASTNTPEPTATITDTPPNTPRPSPTPRPTQTPDLAATQHTDALFSEVQNYYDRGYLTTTEGTLTEFSPFSEDWAQLGWYKKFPLRQSASDFFLSAHFKWNSASQSSNISGCGIIFDLQDNNDHYAVFLDRTRVLFLITDQLLGYSKYVQPTRGTGRVQFEYPAEAHFTLIINGLSAYVLVNGNVVGEYTLAQSRSLEGSLGLTVLSGTNKGYGTHCEMTDLRLWIPLE